MSGNESQPASTSPRTTLEGAVPSLATAAERNAAMDHAFDYRGDVTLYTSDGRVVEGYVYDRKTNTPEPFVRVIPREGTQRLQIPYSQIIRIVFSGKDTAAGKSWETWLKKYHEKRAVGEKASIESEPLE